MPFVIQSLLNFKNYISPPETGHSFKENAEIKSKHFLRFLADSHLLEDPVGILGEDSGLEVKSLKGEPGIYSARYSGPEANDKSNNQLVLKRLQPYQNREARYVCALSFIGIKQGRQTKQTFEAFCEGRMARRERGEGGFGYDPLFIPKGENQTFGELTFRFKQERSHRRWALEKWLKYMEKKGPFLEEFFALHYKLGL